MKKLSFDTLNPEDFTVPVIMRFDAIEENQIINDNLYTKDAFIKLLESKGFQHNTIYDKGSRDSYIFAQRHMYGFLSKKDAEFFKAVFMVDKELGGNKPIFTDCGDNPIMFTELAFYTDKPVDQQYYKILNVENLIDDEDFELTSTWTREYFYWLNSQQKMQPYESSHYNKDFEKLSVEELKPWLVGQFDRFICTHST